MSEITEQHNDFQPVKSALRTVEILALIAKSPGGLTFAEILTAVGWPRSSTYNLLQTLTLTRFLEFDEGSRRYQIGLRLWEAGQGFALEHDIVRTAMPYLEEAKAQLNETVQLAILDGVENVYIAKVEADHHLKLVSEVGSRLPAYATGLGKALLASLTAQEVERRFENVGLRSFTPQTITNLADLHAELELTRERGYAIDRGEYTVGVYCIAVPITDSSSKAVAAISSSVPEPRADDRLKQQMVTTLQLSAEGISRALGASLRGIEDGEYSAEVQWDDLIGQ